MSSRAPRMMNGCCYMYVERIKYRAHHKSSQAAITFFLIEAELLQLHQLNFEPTKAKRATRGERRPAARKKRATMFLIHHLVYPLLLACALSLVYKYILPSAIKGKICPLVMCTLPIIRCVKEPECQRMLDCMVECDDVNSEKRRQAREKYKHLQFPKDPALCSYECIGLITTPTAEHLVECIGNRKCLQPSKYSDACAPIRQDQVLPLSTIPKHILEGRWRKLYTNGWDIWPYQSTTFAGPGGSAVEERDWMTSWPNGTDTWRMDLTWAFENDSRAHQFKMSSELFPGLRWNYPGGTKADPTGRTVARMW